jgi:hypothetical protein
MLDSTALKPWSMKCRRSPRISRRNSPNCLPATRAGYNKISHLAKTYASLWRVARPRVNCGERAELDFSACVRLGNWPLRPKWPLWILP